VIVVEVTVPVDSCVVPSRTTTPGRKPIPVMVMLTLPPGIGFGVTDVICGPAIKSVMDCEPEIFVLLANSALMTWLVYEGMFAGAV